MMSTHGDLERRGHQKILSGFQVLLQASECDKLPLAGTVDVATKLSNGTISDNFLTFECRWSGCLCNKLVIWRKSGWKWPWKS